MNYYSIAIKLKDKYAVVAGGGKIAERKIQTLLTAGIPVSAIAPHFTLPLRLLAKKQKIKLRLGHFSERDLDGAGICIAATNNQKVNKRIHQWASKRNIWVNVVDQPRLSNFISPALIQKQKAIVAVYTDGKDPVLSRDLKNFLKERWNEFLSYRRRLPKRSA